MQWLNRIADDLVKRKPAGEILIESGASPSGTYHFGHLRELITADAILLELQKRGRQARHVQFVDDLDALRKIPFNVPPEYEQHLGRPLCDVPAPDGSDRSYADYFLQGLIDACKYLCIDVDFIRSHERYRSGWMVPAIERALEHVPQTREALQKISGRQLEDSWSPIQVMEDGRLKKRIFKSIDTNTKTVVYDDKNGQPQSASYANGHVKLDWRIDWPGRWWLLSVDCEPSGRDHMTKGSSFDTGAQIAKDVFGAEPPYPVSYDFINMAGDTKKMSASKGTGLDAVEAAQIMPPEVMRFFVLRADPLKRLYFDPVDGVVQLMDEFAAFAARNDRSEGEEQLLYVSTRGLDHKTVSRVPFSLLVASYQAALKDPVHTLQIIGRSEYGEVASQDAQIIKKELQFIDNWLNKYAPDDVKFALAEKVDPSKFTDTERQFLGRLAAKIEQAPADADGDWFHKAIYDLKDQGNLPPKQMFEVLYRAIIGKSHGPRAGWFLSILARDWLIKRLSLND